MEVATGLVICMFIEDLQYGCSMGDQNTWNTFPGSEIQQ
jgi:hypothetical protein